MNPTKQFPHFWHFVWLFFMQPITLHHRLKVTGIKPNKSLLNFKYWFAPDEMRPVKQRYLKQMLWMLFVLMPLASLITFLLTIDIFILLDQAIDLEKSAIYVAINVLRCMVLGVVFGMVVGVAGGVAFGVVFGVASSVAIFNVVMIFCLAGGVAFSVVRGVARGVASGVTRGVVRGMTYGMIVGIISGVAVGLVAEHMVAGMAGGVVFGVIFGVMIIIGLFRIFFYPLEMLVQLLVYWLQALFALPTLRFAPVLYHDLSYLPHPFLARHIILTAATEPQLARRVINACAIAPGQRGAGQTALAHFQAQEIIQLLQQKKFAQLVELQGEWLPGLEGASEFLLSLSEVAHHLQLANTNLIASHRMEHLKLAQEKLIAIKNQLFEDVSPLALALEDTLLQWQTSITHLRQTALAQLQAQELIQLIEQKKFTQLSELQGEWLPRVEDAPRFLLTICEVADCLKSADATLIASHRMEYLEQAKEKLTALENQLTDDLSPLGLALKDIEPHWQTLIADLLQMTQQ